MSTDERPATPWPETTGTAAPVTAPTAGGADTTRGVAGGPGGLGDHRVRGDGGAGHLAWAGSTAIASRTPSAASAFLRLLRSEVRLVLTRRRTIAMLLVLACAPVLIGIAVRVSAPGRGEGPPFLGQISENGLFLAFTALTVTLPFFLPLTMAVVSGESIAGEASHGTLRNLLVVPVGRTRLLAVKYLSVVAYGLVATLVVWGVGVLVGLLLFPRGQVALLSGDLISLGAGVGRGLLVALYVAAMLAAVGAIGMFVSTLTEVPMGAMAACAVITLVSEILGAVPQLRAIWPYLFTTPWFAYGDLMRSPVSTQAISQGLLTAGAYLVVFLALAWARMTTKDVTG